MKDRTYRRAQWDWNLWLYWVMANGVGEVLGLGVVAAAGVTLALAPGQRRDAFSILALAVVMILAGAFEGVAVGVAQWLVLRRRLPALRWQTWVQASAAGAFAAWVLGMIPGTLMKLYADPAAPPPKVNHALMYGMAALMGAVLGPILGVPQWLALRRHVARSGWWVWANAAAWAVGMPVIFIGVGMVARGGSGLRAAVLGLATCATAGAVVGAIHGVALVWLLGKASDADPAKSSAHAKLYGRNERRQAVRQILKAGSLYFAFVFGAGFVLGTIRVLWAIPAFGERIAELWEMPIMFAFIILAARWIVRRLAIPPEPARRLAIGFVALSLLLIVEFTAVLWLRGLTIREYFASRDPVSGTVYFVMLGLFAVMPLLVSMRMMPQIRSGSADMDAGSVPASSPGSSIGKGATSLQNRR
ncbi:MAG: hypothetical protein ABI977_35370 [Acidobacteriota bacterium]